MAYSVDNKWKDAGDEGKRFLHDLLARDLMEETISKRPADRQKELDPEIENRIQSMADRTATSIKDWEGKEGKLHATYINIDPLPGFDDITTVQGALLFIASTLVSLKSYHLNEQARLHNIEFPLAPIPVPPITPWP